MTDDPLGAARTHRLLSQGVCVWTRWGPGGGGGGGRGRARAEEGYSDNYLGRRD